MHKFIKSVTGFLLSLLAVGIFLAWPEVIMYPIGILSAFFILTEGGWVKRLFKWLNRKYSNWIESD